MTASVTSRLLSPAAVVLSAIALTMVFWWPLWTGGGLLGGDVYYYFLPQKAAYADALSAGQWPLWNNRVGHGYPMVGESQTGVFYPPNLVLYGFLPLDRAYAFSMLGHYVLAFIGVVLLARRFHLTLAPSLLAATVYTYGWFPARISLEWAIVGGAWLPIVLWLGESFLQTSRWRYAFGLAVAMAVQMLAGHFTLAFITQLTLAGWTGYRVAVSLVTHRSLAGIGGGRTLAGLGAAVVMGFLLAAVQLAPTWELKQLSQRQTVTTEHDPGYGYLPPKYLLQVVAPWFWYVHQGAFNSTMIPGGSRTNRIEAHLFFGLVPLALALVGIACAIFRRRGRDGHSAASLRSDGAATAEHAEGAALTSCQIVAGWCLIGSASVVYATGCLIPLTKHLPGFSFFEGPGRYGVSTTLAVGLLAAFGIHCLRNWVHRSGRALLLVVVFAATVGDLWLVSRPAWDKLLGEHRPNLGDVQWDAILVEDPPIRHREESELRKRLLSLPQPARLLTPANNAGTILGVAAVPSYLGLAPAAYFDPQRKIPDPIPFETRPTAEQLSWLRRAGVTHLLTLRSLSLSEWTGSDGRSAIRLIGRFPDPVLNRVLATPAPLWLYELQGSRGRVSFDGKGSATLVHHSPNEIVIESRGEAATVILTELAFPGWEVSVDGQPAAPREIDGMYRGIDVPEGTHRIVWSYRPASLFWGGIVSGVALLVWLTLGHLWFWRDRCW